MKNKTEELQQKFEILKNYYNSNQFELAFEKAQLLMKEFPNVPVLYNFLGLVLVRLQKTKDAIKAYQTAIKLNPKMSIAYSNLGNIYHRVLNDTEMAKKSFEKAIHAEPNFAVALNNLGNLYKDLNQPEQAIEYLKKAIEKEPKLFTAYKNLGVAYSSMGDFKKSIEYYYKALSINPDYLESHREIALLTKYEKNNEHLKLMEKIFKNPNLKDDNKMNLAMALGKAYEDTREYKKSFDKYLLGNSLKRKTFKYKIQQDKKMFDAIQSSFNKKLFEKFKNSGYKNFSPIFIVGMPRSGTSLVEQIIASHPDVYGAGELLFIQKIIYDFSDRKPLKFFENIKDIKEDMLIEMGKNYEKTSRVNFKFNKYLTDKYPHNFLFIGLIKMILPEAKIIHCDRDARDNCFSIFKNFFSGNILFGYDLNELGKYHNLYKNLMSHWKNTIPDFIYDMPYEKLVSDLEIESKKLLNFCNLPWNENCLKFYKTKRAVNTASLSQVRQPVYKSSVKSWKNYKDYLKPLLSELKN